ncbi:MAG: hypothetical protein AUH81_18500 [Candidatus Rokubacteria bacterium 13_1_40CM_4_69_5]|nr:MAG: hypothetical protein AUH81_18500 [Candidatus Rokubacteria bacterium 13_1_40CM_4_69_5]
MVVRAAALLLLMLVPSLVAAEPWTAARISRLPDSAFAVVETGADGRKVRHLPHHDETGAVDLAHLTAARGRLGQVRWLDPANAAIAHRHLEEHWRALGRAAP